MRGCCAQMHCADGQMDTHGHPSLHSWSPFSARMVTLLYTHGHPFLHSLMVTLLYTHGHPSLHSWSPFSALMVTLLYTHGHPSLHSWSPFSALMVTFFYTHGHPPHLWSPSPLMVTLLYTQPSVVSPLEMLRGTLIEVSVVSVYKHFSIELLKI